MSVNLSRDLTLLQKVHRVLKVCLLEKKLFSWGRKRKDRRKVDEIRHRKSRSNNLKLFFSPLLTTGNKIAINPCTEFQNFLYMWNMDTFSVIHVVILPLKQLFLRCRQFSHHVIPLIVWEMILSVGWTFRILVVMCYFAICCKYTSHF